MYKCDYGNCNVLEQFFQQISEKTSFESTTHIVLHCVATTISIQKQIMSS